MKKHAGKFFQIGLMVSVFGLLIMGAVNIATGTILGQNYNSAPNLVQDVVGGATDASWALIIIGACLLIAGVFMITRAD